MGLKSSGCLPCQFEYADRGNVAFVACHALAVFPKPEWSRSENEAMEFLRVVPREGVVVPV